MMSAETSTEAAEPSFSVPVVAHLTVHVTASGTGKKKSTKKETKTKEFTHTFSATKSNYMALLSATLEKHHIGNKLQVTEH